MPVVKQSWVKKPEALEKYLDKDRAAEPVRSASNGLSEEMAKTIRQEHEKHRKNVKNLALTIIQSWPEKESDLFSPEKYNEMGQELAKRIAPGHTAFVVTHTEKNHIHNHIVISSVNSETGKLLNNKRSEFLKMRETNNEIARENGFSVTEKKSKEYKSFDPYRAQDMAVRGKKSWLFDMKQKADFARAASTSFDEYVGLLKFQNVHVRIEEKNISYSYGNSQKAIRGDRVGDKFNKAGLMKAFKENDERFANTPGLRDRTLSDFGAAFDGKGNFVGTQSDLLPKPASHTGLGKKDYSQFTKIDRNRTRDELPAIFDRSGGILYHEMKKASEKSIFKYCEENKISLKMNKDGKKVLHGREFVIVEDKSWTNAKNGREGTIIDFVKAHKQTTELGAVAILNNNPRLLLLEPYLGSYQKGVQSFYFPKPKSALPEVAQKTMQSFMRSRGINESHTEAILKSKSIHVGSDKSIWLMGEKEQSAIEFKEESNGQWKSKHHGKMGTSFFESITSSNKMIVHRNPFEFLVMGLNGKSAHSKSANVFVALDEGSEKRLTEIVALNPHIEEVHFVPAQNHKEHEKEKSFAEKMKAQFNPFDILVKELSMADLSHDRGLGPDIGM